VNRRPAAGHEQRVRRSIVTSPGAATAAADERLPMTTTAAASAASTPLRHVGHRGALAGRILSPWAWKVTAGRQSRFAVTTSWRVPHSLLLPRSLLLPPRRGQAWARGFERATAAVNIDVRRRKLG